MDDKRVGDEYDAEEIARRRDEVIRRMANTPPQPKPKKGADAVPSKRRSPKNSDRET